jgi:hypothetical protein
MNRTHFIKSLGLGASGLILPLNPLISTRSVKIYDNYIRGLTHYDFKKISDTIKEGDEVQLLRETDNMYDSFAVQVNLAEQRLGYLAAYENIVLANMIDAGVGLRAFISQKDLKRHAQEWLALEIFAELILPSQRLQDSLLAYNRADNAPDLYRLGEI